MASLTIRLSTQDLNLLQRIAEHDDRRVSDFVQLMFSRGLEFYYCDEIVHIQKLPDEYTKEERDQQMLNAELITKYNKHDERIEHGFKYVQSYLSNYEKDPNTDEHKDKLIEPMVKRIKAYALK